MDRGARRGRKQLDTTEQLNHQHNVHVFPNDRKEQSELKSEVKHQLHLLYCGLSSSGRTQNNKIYTKQTHTSLYNII